MFTLWVLGVHVPVSKYDDHCLKQSKEVSLDALDYSTIPWPLGNLHCHQTSEPVGVREPHKEGPPSVPDCQSFSATQGRQPMVSLAASPCCHFPQLEISALASTGTPTQLAETRSLDQVSRPVCRATRSRLCELRPSHGSRMGLTGPQDRGYELNDTIAVSSILVALSWESKQVRGASPPPGQRELVRCDQLVSCAVIRFRIGYLP